MLKLKIVPSWLKAALEGHGKSVDVVLDQAQLLNTLSIPDVAFYAHLNTVESMKKLLGKAYVDTFDVSAVPVEGIERAEPHERETDTVNKLYEEIQLYEYRMNMNGGEYFKELLIGLGIYEADRKVREGELNFRILRQTEDALLIEPISDKHQNLTRKEENDLNRENVFKVLGILCTVFDFKDVARTALFKHYCRLVNFNEEGLV